MSFLKVAFGLTGVDRVAEQIIKDAESRKAEGNHADFWTEYSQRDIGVRLNASIAGSIVERQLDKAGLKVIKVQATGRYGDSVRMLIANEPPKTGKQQGLGDKPDPSLPAHRRHPLPDGLTDEQWWDDAVRRYEEYWRDFAGSPDSLSTGANWFYHDGEFGAAALTYQKAIDLLHTYYCCNDLEIIRTAVGVRQPSAEDLRIIDGYQKSLGASLSLHPEAPVEKSVNEVAHRLRQIFITCKRAGLPAGLYGNAMLELEPIASRYGIFIDPDEFKDPKTTVINNQGIMAKDNAVVSGNAIASASGAHAAVSATSSPSADQIADLLRQFIEQLSLSEHADKAELTATAGEACAELAMPAPRLARLKILAAGLAAAVRGFGSLAVLASQIEQAIHNL
jgi:hypothetical protein